MKNLILILVVVLQAGLSGPAFAQKANVEPFLGMWALELDYENENAGWLEVRQGKDNLDSEILWKSGSVYPIDFTFVEGEELFLTQGRDVAREKDKDGNLVRTLRPGYWFNIKMDGDDKITGTRIDQRGNGIRVQIVSFTGKRIPPYGEAPDTKKIKYGEPVTLFNGKDLEGWEMLNKNSANGWKAVDGVLVNNPVRKDGERLHYGNLRTTDTFEDFNLKIEVNIPEGNNGGIYLRGIYEVQVLDS
ncbi:MAG: DUF1080 domain-containing protein, partial [Bacteroidales bacterium]|nr:DUF1080 domain-containing protein [Bacteroidales bacterium]